MRQALAGNRDGSEVRSGPNLHLFRHWKRISRQHRCNGVEVLSEQRSLTNEKELPGGSVRGGRIGVEETPGLRPVQLTDIHATGSGATLHVVEDVVLVG